jgi:hypothetical protein
MNPPRHRVAGRGLATLALAAVAGPSACDRPPEIGARPAASARPAEASAPAPRPAGDPIAIPPRPGLSALEPGATLPTAAGQQVYLPIHARVAAEDGRKVRLAVNVAVRNTDEARTILVTLLRHRDADGRTVRDYLRAPIRLAPKASLDVVIKDGDASAEASASVLVEWCADRPVAPPLVESVMIGTFGSQGISFAERGVVLEDRLHPAAPPR